MKQTIRKLFSNETFLASLLIIMTAAVTYGVSIPRLGYYYDDWYLLWSGQVRGAGSIISLFSTDRPFMGVVYSLVYRLLGDSILNWHLYALAWRIIGGLAFFWILRLIWPNNKYLTTLLTVLFVVYPGFLSQPDANTKQNHLYGFATALLSIALLLQALKVQSKFWKGICWIASMLLAINYFFIYEYMIGLEGMRLALLGYALYQAGSRDIRSLGKGIIKNYWPYILAGGGFLYWRLFIFVGTRNATNPIKLAGSYLNDLRHMAIRLILESGKDFLDTTIFAWFVKPYTLISSAVYSDLGLAVVVAGVVIGLGLVYLYFLKKWWHIEYDREETPRPAKIFLWLGVFIVFCAVVPVVASGRDVDLTDPYKSYGLHPIGGVMFFIAGLVLMIKPRFRRLALLALIGISVSTQVLNGVNWAQFWNYERETWWQLTWRAPDIQDNTMMMVYLPDGYRLQQDYETWGPANLIYNPVPANAPSIQSEVLTPDTAYDIIKGNILDNRMRDMKMHRDFNNLLLITIPSNISCMHVIDGTLPVYSESEALLVEQVGSYSKIDRIITTGTAPTPSVRIFGPEPVHDWCFYYQQASLARQKGDWKEITRLYGQVQSLHLEALDKTEVFPFFEALVNLGEFDQARDLFNSEIKGRSLLRLPLCNSLATDPGYPPAFGYNYKKIREILCDS